MVITDCNFLSEFSTGLNEASYQYSEGPLTQASGFHKEKLLVNCQFFVHIVLEELGFSLPKWLRSAELYRRSAGGRVWVDRVENQHDLRLGDLLLFSPRKIQHIQDPLIFRLHIGICIDPVWKQIVHISRYEPNGLKHANGGAVYEQSLCDILRSPRYNTLVGIRRTKQ